MSTTQRYSDAPLNATRRYESGPGQAGQVRSLLRVLADIVIILDRTESMSDCIEGVKRCLQIFIDQLLCAHIDVSLGLVLFRDEMYGEEPECHRVGTPPENLKSILAAAQAVGGGDLPESSLLAIRHALALPGYRAEARKILFLVTDAPPHDPEKGVSWPDILSQLHREHVTFFACCKSIEPYLTFVNSTQGTLFPLKDHMAPDAFKDIMLQFAQGTIKTLRLQDGTIVSEMMHNARHGTQLLHGGSATGDKQ